MFGVIAHGLIVGLTLAFSVGPVFFGLIDTSISRGFREAAKFALGISLSDLLFATVASLGIGSLVLSMGLLGLALRTLPLGTAYAVWTGIGTVGTAIVGMVVLREPATAARLVCIALIVAGIVGLKLVTRE